MRHLQGIGIIALSSIIAGSFTYIFFPNKRKKLIKIALSQVDKANINEYWTDAYGATSDKDWCGVFILWALHKSGIATDWKWEVGKGFIYKLPTTLIPKPGDIAYFTKNQHQALISKIDGEMISLINGNGFNGVVSTSVTPKSNITTFYSIESLLK